MRNQEYVFSRFREIMQAKSNGTEEEPPSDFLQVYLSKSEKERSVDGMTGNETRYTHQTVGDLLVVISEGGGSTRLGCVLKHPPPL